MPAKQQPHWTQVGDKLISTIGDIYDINPRACWYVAPARTTYERGEARVRPLDFAMVLHNAVMGHGLVTSLNVLLADIEPKTIKRGTAAEAEALLERIRQEEFPSRPSRLRSYFLSFDRDLAECRLGEMFRVHRRVERCFLVCNGGKFHFADVEVYERLEGRPDDDNLARKYWQTYIPEDEEQRLSLEILADSALFFPDWKSFPTLDDRSLANWMLDNLPPEKAGV